MRCWQLSCCLYFGVVAAHKPAFKSKSQKSKVDEEDGPVGQLQAAVCFAIVVVEARVTGLERLL